MDGVSEIIKDFYYSGRQMEDAYTKMENDNSIVDQDDRSPSDCSVNSDSKPSSSWVSGKGRKPNWTDVEIRTLIQEYDKYREVMRSKGGYGPDGQKKSQYSNVEKHKVWKVITDAVNCSKVDGVNLSGTSVCERTVKEVIKKWVNLANKMKCDLASQRRHPGINTMCATSRAVNTILNTDDPLDIDSIMSKATPLIESNGPVDPLSRLKSSGDVIVKVEKSDEIEEYHKKYRRILPNSLRDVILKRKTGDEPVDSPVDTHVTTVTSTPTKKCRLRFDSEIIDNSHRVQSDAGTTYSTDVYNDSCATENGVTDNETAGFTPLFNADYHTDDFMQLNKEVLELKKKKLAVKIDKLVLDKEKAQFEKERAEIEKVTAEIAQEKMKLELEKLKKSLEK